MGRFEVDSETIAATATAVHHSIESVVGETDRMMHNLEALQGTWRGQAAESFAGLTTEWRATQQRVHASAASIQAALARAGQQYEEVEAATVRMFTG